MGTVALLVMLAAAPALKADAVALQKYGSKSYAPLVNEFNGLKPGQKPKGPLNSPSFADGFHSLGMPLEIEGVASHIGLAAERLWGIAVDVKELRPTSGAAQVKLATPLVLRIREVQTDLAQAISALRYTESKWTPPERAISALTRAGDALDSLAEGKLAASEDSDIQKIHRDIAEALVDIIRWEREGFR